VKNEEAVSGQLSETDLKKSLKKRVDSKKRCCRIRASVEREARPAL